MIIEKWLIGLLRNYLIMNKIKLENKNLMGYYLMDTFYKDNKSGLKFISNEEKGRDDIELHYKDEEDLSKKLSYILLILTDK